MYSKIKEEIDTLGFNVVDYDFNRPWGGFLVIDEKQRSLFISTFFNDININLSKDTRLSPKILIVDPNSRLSWQYHFRRKEIWKIYKGSVGVIRSKNDIETKINIHKSGDTITFDIQERHRLIGLKNIGIVAEIWQHTDINNPSDENDIVRLQDDYNRK
ncbi:MAG: phosphoheptose isomerase [Flavobacteriaceae bacterium]|nr:phosphoheptose isomerase [Flavobacteriaceae bacterium]MBT4112734.1 phosphoheptose isomerase [Flavobacteriaceae bacterium]MBT4613993.1 phosphoheptose isomerase [Flavobacteriaceae bacterium]MBT5246643.1 phosphoheptose isomerase [Flavobacteriaceae bacterium]MBT5650237.1 phosphoheptose isomerase [Flavobacteriaceae bacterium]